MVLSVENVYEDGVALTFPHAVVPAPADWSDLQEWAEEHLLPLTGAGRSGDAGYFARIEASSDARLVGESFEWV